MRGLKTVFRRPMIIRTLLFLSFSILACPDTGFSEPLLPEDGDVRLADEAGNQGQGAGGVTRGNVLVYHSGQWWAVCDDRWSIEAAGVVCRRLGYSGASSHTTQSYFGRPQHAIGLDDVRCAGNESSLLDCDHLQPLGANDCNVTEAAGVTCLSSSSSSSSSSVTSSSTSSTSSSSSSPPPTQAKRKKSKKERRVVEPERKFLEANELFMEAMQLDEPVRTRHRPSAYSVRVVGGRVSTEGRVEVNIGGRWGVICSDRWTQMEARVACRQAGLGLARSAVKSNYFGGSGVMKLAAGIECDGDEERLSDCYHEQSGAGTVCSASNLVAGVHCATKLPDLVPNATLLEQSTYLQDRAMYYLQCAMEENCASSSAFQIRATNRDWHIHRRRLLRFSSSTWNFGTAPFLPASRKETWQWHMCHMHYHSMSTFAQYDVLDLNGNKVAEGHKASFCLEDVRCMPGVTKKYACAGFGDQGISVGCADDYLHDIDCQWIDVTDLSPGNYVFRVKVNPDYLVAELDYNNNAAICQMEFTRTSVRVSKCALGRG